MTVALFILGAALITAAGFLVTPAAGLGAAGAACLWFTYRLETKDDA